MALSKNCAAGLILIMRVDYTRYKKKKKEEKKSS
jgi:hypothetical protein